MKSLITVPIKGKTLKECEGQIKMLPKEVQAYELWIDQLKDSDQDPDLIEEACKAWRKLSKKKLVLVCKDLSEKGKFKDKHSKKIELLLAASRGGAHYIDIGLQTGKAQIRKLVMENQKSKVIVSFHDFEKIPSQKRLDSLVEQMQHLGADVIKIASFAHDPVDTERLMELAVLLKKQKKAHIILGMGQLGVLTRVFADQIGNELNFVTLDHKTAPGQLSLDQMLAFSKIFP